MLAQTLGPGKAQVLVYANMNVDQTTKESLEYAKAGTPLQQTKSLETLQGNGSGAGATGTANVPAAAQSGGKSNYKKETSTQQNGVSKTVTHSTVAPGTVETQHVSVLLDHSVPASAVPAIKEAVTNAAGINAKRGDTISIGQIAFAKGGATRRGRLRRDDRLRQVRAAGDRRRGVPVLHHALAAPPGAGDDSRARAGCASSRRPCASPSSSARCPRGRASSPPAAANGHGNGARNVGAGSSDDIRRQVEQLADSDPDRVAQQVRSWIQEG